MSEPLAIRGEALPPHNENAICPKCLHPTVRTTYRPQTGCADPKCRRCEAEHLERMCERCHYHWAEATCDLAAVAGHPAGHTEEVGT